MRDEERKRMLDKVSSRLDRAEKKRKIASVTPPIPISYVVRSLGEDGIIGSYLCAADGIITKLYAYVDKVEKDTNVNAVIRIVSNLETREFRARLKTGMISLDIEFPLYAGDRVSVLVDQPDKVSDIWFTCLYEIALKQATHEYFLIEELKKVDSATEEEG